MQSQDIDKTRHNVQYTQHLVLTLCGAARHGRRFFISGSSCRSLLSGARGSSPRVKYGGASAFLSEKMNKLLQSSVK